MHTRPVGARRARGRRGFTIVELIVAMMVLTVGVLGLCSTATVVSRLIGGAAQQTIAASVASARFERMRSLQCSAITPGTATTRGMQEAWSTTLSGARLYLVVDTVRYRAAGGRVPAPLAFDSYVRC